jgi:flagellar L-ring protein precursor FlgH
VRTRDVRWRRTAAPAPPAGAGEDRRAEQRSAFRRSQTAPSRQTDAIAWRYAPSVSPPPQPANFGHLRLLTPLAAVLLLGGCGLLSRLSEVGRPPAMTTTADPTKETGWRPLTMPMPAREAAPTEPDALWRSGSRAFFKDQRAAQVGDVITVVVSMTDSANIQNATTATRASADSAGIPNLFGLENLLPSMLPKPINPSSLVSVSSANNNAGTAQIQRSEAVTLRLAGVVTQVLPNGNLVVAARQEILVNSELRQLQVTGVVRPQDIASDNTVTHDRMAEARISYGGRGQLTDVQSPRWGQQIMDIVLPF